MSELKQLGTPPSDETETSTHDLFLQGRAAHQRKDFPLAQRLYDQVILSDPDHSGAAHLLGMVHYETGDPYKAMPLILRALELTQWQMPLLRQHLGLVLYRLVAQRDGLEASNALSKKGQRYRALLADKEALLSKKRSNEDSPLVSVVVLNRNGAHYLRSALQSIYTQSYRRIEVIVMDDGSTDDSCDVARACLQECPFAHRLVCSGNREPQVSLNEGIRLSKGQYINPLDSSDQFAPRRIECLVSAANAFSGQLAFGGVRYMDIHQSQVDPFADKRVYSFLSRQANIAYCETVGHAFLIENVAIAAGNLFFSRTLFDALDGFRDFRHRHIWDFCLRALSLTEPLFVDNPLYYHRLFATAESPETDGEIVAESIKIYTDYFSHAFDSDQHGQEFTPNFNQWGNRFAVEVLRSGFAPILPPTFLKKYADQQLSAAVTAT